MTLAPLSHDTVLSQFAAEVSDSGPIAISGNRTRWNVGGQLATGARVITAPTGVVKFQPEEMTVVVRAGTTVTDLLSVLAQNKQRCALPDRGGTVGGAIAVGENDLAVLGKSTVRSSVLEVRYVSAEGRLIRGGGPTVKNVTGFDLPRLMVGSLGTLGCLAEVILRTQPMPAVSQWFEVSQADAFEVFQKIFRPSVILWNGATTWVLLEGHAQDVREQAAMLSRMGESHECEKPPLLPYRWSLAPSDVRHISQLTTGDFVASIGVGMVFAEKPQPPRELPPQIQVLTDRIKSNFDPKRRLNPGRSVGVR